MNTIPISQIKPNPDNPRFIKDYKFKKLVKSIKEFPQMLKLRPIVVNSDMVVLGGNMRLKACIEAGITEVPVLKADDLTPEQQREFIVKDNVGFGEWDWDLLANEWDSVQLEDWGMDNWQNMDDILEQDIKEQKDLSDSINSSFRLEVELENEIEQEKLYNELINKGYICRLLTL
jgi:ParB-like chromosome segregation protein Spo0J